MAIISILPTNGLEAMGLLEEVGLGLYRIRPDAKVVFYGKEYTGPTDESLHKAVTIYNESLDTKKEGFPFPMDYV